MELEQNRNTRSIGAMLWVVRAACVVFVAGVVAVLHLLADPAEGASSPTLQCGNGPTDGECPGAKLATTTATEGAPPLSEMPTASNSSPLTLSIEAPTRNTFRLIYLPTDGWTFTHAQPIETAQRAIDSID